MDSLNPRPDPDEETLVPDTDRSTSERGQGLVEYAMIVMLIAIVVIVAVQVLGTKTATLYSNISNGLGA